MILGDWEGDEGGGGGRGEGVERAEGRPALSAVG